MTQGVGGVEGESMFFHEFKPASAASESHFFGVSCSFAAYARCLHQKSRWENMRKWRVCPDALKSVLCAQQLRVLRFLTSCPNQLVLAPVHPQCYWGQALQYGNHGWKHRRVSPILGVAEAPESKSKHPQNLTDFEILSTVFPFLTDSRNRTVLGGDIIF